MADYVIYGKIIIDTIRLLNGVAVRGVLGGGGPQGAFGARVWDKSVGLLTRSGWDLDQSVIDNLYDLDVDLQGWVIYPALRTPRGTMEYDKNEYHQYTTKEIEPPPDLKTIVNRNIDIPPDYQDCKSIHLITEFANEHMVKLALELKGKGAILSLEPLILLNSTRSNAEEMLQFLPQVDIVTPDWPSASGIAGSDDPKKVLAFWSKLGPQCVAVRNGKHGSYVWDAEHDQMWHIPIIKIEALDPTGCGNAYGGGFCVGWTRTRDALIAGCYGGISASFMAQAVGCAVINPEIETQAQLLLDSLISRARPL